MGRGFVIALALLSGVWAQAGEDPAGRPVPRHEGLYAVVRTTTLDKVEEVAALPCVDGVTFYIGVKALMPAKGRYDWSRIDRVIKTARDNHKKVSLAFLPGRWTPDWFYEEGVKKVEWTHETKLVDPGKYETASPVPWDPKLLELLGEMMKTAGKRYTTNPVVAAVHVVGPAMANGLEGNFNVSPAEAEAMGYTPEKYVAAWKTMFDATARSFPFQKICWCIQDQFPGKRDGKPGREIRDWAKASAFGKRFHLMACYLTHEPWFKRGNQAVDLWGERLPDLPAGLQLINIYSQKGYTPEQFKQALDTGIREGADYLEVFAEDLLNPEYRAVAEQVRKTWKGE